MTNEEKAREIAECNDGHINIISFESAKIMVEWKDKQFKEYLEKKRLEYAHKREAHKFKACNEIINELFKED